VDLGWHNFCLGQKGPLEDICRQVQMPNMIEWISLVNRGRLQIGDEVMDYGRKAFIKLLPDKEQGNLQKLFSQAAAELSEQEINKLWYVPLDDWVNNFTRNPLAHTIVDSLASQYFCVSSSEASAAEWIKCFREVVTCRATAYPKGGNISVPKAYISAIKKYGGDVKLNAKVKGVMAERGVAVGVRLEDGLEFRAPVVISNADIKATVNDLVGEEHFPGDYVRRIQKLTYSSTGVILKVAMKEKIADDFLVVYIPDEHSPTLGVTKEMRNGKMPEWVGGLVFCPTNVDTSLSPSGKQLISFFTACPPDQDWQQWKKVLLNNFYRVYPQAKGKILRYWLETPNLVNAYAGEEGNIIGVGQTVDQIHERRPSAISPVKGLYFSSADVGRHGIGTELAANAAKELFGVLTSK
jgi:prolycopene isomerase